MGLELNLEGRQAGSGGRSEERGVGSTGGGAKVWEMKGAGAWGGLTEQRLLLLAARQGNPGPDVPLGSLPLT